MKRIASAAVALALVGCSTVPPATYYRPIKPEEALDRKLAATLRDPSSAQQYAVGDVFQCNVGILGGKYCMCFKINAKNGFGGYVGAKTMVAWFSANGYEVEGIQEVVMFSPGQECTTAPLTPRDPQLLAK